ncbi:hypothetical protein ACQJ22_09665 [Pseudomonas fragariae (ex Marin et al. 2024)]|uniref:hypothetical protein n=1 Tax=Pseudomonas TaxID=286 RepID=UPI00044E4EB2|nr:hypothetical protein [Pseudomonas syringae]AKF47637.1 hypothetical protein PsyrB_20915 [Pseudomonas syringae pv. syringae B301D]EXL32518.1 hypothetical protein PssB301D_01339 [Pseudomonas syringae pv. syringae str. B301D-R]MCH5554105.1 hypothetical protein [Pseudomonas syringae pv. syringae]MCH5574082.1 hypothetical protein [Pseudomonas syringae pv. syringae]MCH5667223.1 hypothetical protein [Pseudomonas syringae pv. syringae]
MMLAYKIMRSIHYEPGKPVMTTAANYGNRMLKSKATNELIRTVIDTSKRYGIPIQPILFMCIDFQKGSDQPRIPRIVASPRVRELRSLATGSAHSILDGTFSASFWEYLYEHVRSADRPACPSRVESYFASKDLNSLARYRDSHWATKMEDKMVCQINFEACPVVFEADMFVLDRVTDDMNFETARAHILRYWDQEMSFQPNIEMLLQGTIVLGNRVELN